MQQQHMCCLVCAGHNYFYNVVNEQKNQKYFICFVNIFNNFDFIVEKCPHNYGLAWRRDIIAIFQVILEIFQVKKQQWL